MGSVHKNWSGVVIRVFDREPWHRGPRNHFVVVVRVNFVVQLTQILANFIIEWTRIVSNGISVHIVSKTSQDMSRHV